MFRRKLVFLVLAEAVLLAAVVSAFWWQDWRYAQPTAVPPGLVQPPVGTSSLPAELPADNAGPRPTLLHFFNPDCPCSRFNLDEARGLHRDFDGRVRFVAVLQGDDAESLPGAFARLNWPVETLTDAGGRIATRLGVYSTPQAVVLDADGRLLFRGNYNVARYCKDPRTAFARLALDAVVAGRPLPVFPPAAEIAYGCPLPQPRKDQP